MFGDVAGFYSGCIPPGTLACQICPYHYITLHPNLFCGNHTFNSTVQINVRDFIMNGFPSGTCGENNGILPFHHDGNFIHAAFQTVNSNRNPDGLKKGFLFFFLINAVGLYVVRRTSFFPLQFFRSSRVYHILIHPSLGQ